MRIINGIKVILFVILFILMKFVAELFSCKSKWPK